MKTSFREPRLILRFEGLGQLLLKVPEAEIENMGVGWSRTRVSNPHTLNPN